MSGVAVFDFDGTVIRGDSIVAMVREAREKGCVGRLEAARAGLCGALYHLHLMEALPAKRRAHAFLTRLAPDAREAFLRAFAGSLAARAFPAALRQMEAHRRAGELVVLCSASGACYMRYVAELLGADALLCTPCAENGEIIGPNCRGQEKVRRVHAWLDRQGLPHDAVTAAYGDSPGDAFILRASRRPVLVNAKKKLIRSLPEAERTVWREG